MPIVAMISAALVTMGSAQSPALRFGAGEGTNDETFTQVAGAVIDPFGRIVVLDGGEKHLVVFSKAGKPLQVLGRRGGGPGEFGSPNSIALTGTQRIVAVDPQLSRLTVYDASRPDSIRLEAQWGIDVRGNGMCAAGNRVYVLADGRAAMIHEYIVGERTAAPARSFGAPMSRRPQGADPRLRMLTVSGPLACSPDGQRVAFASMQLGEVRVFDVRTGTPTVFSPAAPFRGIGFDLEGGGVRYVWPKDGLIDQVVGLTIADDGSMLLNVGTRQRGADTEATGYEFRPLSPVGRPLERVSAESRLLTSSASRLVCLRTDPIPELLVYERARLKHPWCL